MNITEYILLSYSDILKLFTPMEPAPFENIVKYMKKLKSLEKMKIDVVNKCDEYQKSMISHLNSVNFNQLTFDDFKNEPINNNETLAEINEIVNP
jgi:hypothetical protein